MSKDANESIDDPGLAKTALIRELVDLSRFTDGILRTLGSAVIAVDSGRRVTFVNPAAEELLALPANRLLHQPVDSILVTRGGGSLIADVSDAESAGEVDIELVDGRLVTVEVRLSRQETEDGSGGLVAILTDRTDLKRAEQEARRKERLASLGELSAGIAHEIRNPLTGIGASAQLLKSRLAGEENHIRLTDVILDEVARLDRIVESMLDFASPAQPRFRRLSLTACLEKAVELVREEAESNGVCIDTRFDEVPSAWIDPDQMEQVFLNLVKNAIQAMEDSGGDLKLGVRHVERPTYVRRQAGRRAEDRGRLEAGTGPLQSWVEVEVTDTGHGMEPGVVERIFNPFYTTRRRGTGLGLSITQSIVQEHGGMISVTSTPGRGTTVLVDLPEERRSGNRRGADGER